MDDAVPLPSRAQLQHAWDALSPDEQAESYARFEQLCQCGLGDTHAFYRVLMPQALHGYVGD